MIIATHGILANATLPSTLNNGLFSVYKAESNANDSLGVYNGTAQGGLTYTTGKSGNAFTGNGTNAYIQLPNDSHNFAGDFSVNMWFNLASTAGTFYMFSNLDNTVGNIRSYGYSIIYTGLGNSVRFSIYGTSTLNLEAIFTTSTNNWFMVTVTRKASTRSRIYINGNLVNSNTSTMNPIYTGIVAPCFGVGKSITSGYQSVYLTNGSKLDEIGIWSRELTQAEITEAYNSASGKFYPY
jgi:hypothetical protein